jgi:hypothetical protein
MARRGAFRSRGRASNSNVILEFYYTIAHTFRMKDIHPATVAAALANFVVVRLRQTARAKRLEHGDEHQRRCG